MQFNVSLISKQNIIGRQLPLWFVYYELRYQSVYHSAVATESTSNHQKSFVSNATTRKKKKCHKKNKLHLIIGMHSTIIFGLSAAIPIFGVIKENETKNNNNMVEWNHQRNGYDCLTRQITS